MQRLANRQIGREADRSTTQDHDRREWSLTAGEMEAEKGQEVRVVGCLTPLFQNEGHTTASYFIVLV